MTNLFSIPCLPICCTTHALSLASGWSAQNIFSWVSTRPLIYRCRIFIDIGWSKSVLGDNCIHWSSWFALSISFPLPAKTASVDQERHETATPELEILLTCHQCISPYSRHQIIFGSRRAASYPLTFENLIVDQWLLLSSPFPLWPSQTCVDIVGLDVAFSQQRHS